MPMEGLKRRLSFRKKKKDVKVPECSKPHQWQEDEKKVREGSCSFQVRYLGCVEVFESRGMQVCEEAVKTLKTQCKGKYQRAILYVSGDALRVVDEISKSMIVDQTIEKVSFCAPDRNHEKGFAYICRDGTTRRWMCHGFLAVKESGERLSHAVGCAFAICLERKQKRDKESGASNVTVTFSQDRTCFTRMGSFRQTTLTERITDPQSAILSEPVPVRKVDNPYAVQRPHATDNMLLRQGSFRGFSKLQETTSPFKRTLSLRINELPSTLQRQNAVEFSPTKGGLNNNGVIPEMSPEKDDSISQMCQQLTQGLQTLTDDPFASAPMTSPHPAGPIKQHSMPATFHTSTAMVHHPTPPIHETNPWASPTPAVGPGADHFTGRSTPSTNPFVTSATSTMSPVTNGTVASGSLSNPAVSNVTLQHMRSHSIDTSDMSGWHPDHARHPDHTRKQTLLTMTQHQSFQQGSGNPAAGNTWAHNADWSPGVTARTSSQSQSESSNVISNTTETFDPFDIAWAARQGNKQEGANAGTQVSTKTTYKVEL